MKLYQGFKQSTRGQAIKSAKGSVDRLASPAPAALPPPPAGGSAVAAAVLPALGPAAAMVSCRLGWLILSCPDVRSFYLLVNNLGGWGVICRWLTSHFGGNVKELEKNYHRKTSTAVFPH